VAGLLDVKEIIFRRHFTERQSLDAVRLSVGREDEQIAEATDPFPVTPSMSR
jgi:hypothetical protein